MVYRKFESSRTTQNRLRPVLTSLFTPKASHVPTTNLLINHLSITHHHLLCPTTRRLPFATHNNLGEGWTRRGGCRVCYDTPPPCPFPLPLQLVFSDPWLTTHIHASQLATKRNHYETKMSTEHKGEGQGTVDKMRGRACTVRPHCILYTYWLSTRNQQNHDMQWGGVYSSSWCHCHFDATRRGIPSLSCRCYFNTTRRGMPLPFVLLPFQRDKEGHAPPWLCCCHFDATRRDMPLPSRVVAISMWQGGESPPFHVIAISTQRGGGCPSPVCCCHFNATRRDMPLPGCVVAISMRRGGTCLSPVVSLPFRCDEEGDAPSHRVVAISRRGGTCPLLVMSSPRHVLFQLSPLPPLLQRGSCSTTHRTGDERGFHPTTTPPLSKHEMQGEFLPTEGESAPTPPSLLDMQDETSTGTFWGVQVISMRRRGPHIQYNGGHPRRVDESLTSLAMYFRNWHMFREYMNNIPC